MTKEYAFIARSGYALSALLLLLPMADIALGFLPLQINNLRWRIGVTGMTTGALLLPITGLVLALGTAHARGDRGVQTFLAILAVVGSLMLFAASVMFTLDTLQLRSEVDERGRHLYDRAAIKGILSQILTASIVMFIAISSLRTARMVRQARQRSESKAAPVIGRPDVKAGS